MPARDLDFVTQLIDAATGERFGALAIPFIVD